MTAEQVALLAGWASHHDGIAAVWLFGSRARGDYRPDSDYDIALELMPKPGLDDPPFTAYFFECEKWKAELRNLLCSEISLVCYRDDFHCKFDPRVKKIWSRPC